MNHIFEFRITSLITYGLQTSTSWSTKITRLTVARVIAQNLVKKASSRLMIYTLTF